MLEDQRIAFIILLGITAYSTTVYCIHIVQSRESKRPWLSVLRDVRKIGAKYKIVSVKIHENRTTSNGFL